MSPTVTTSSLHSLNRRMSISARLWRSWIVHTYDLHQTAVILVKEAYALLNSALQLTSVSQGGNSKS